MVLKKKEIVYKKYFYVTPIVKCLFENFTSLQENKEAFKFLIVETNFSIFAYISSELEKSILELLCEINYAFNGLLVGTITRSSIRRALMKGVNFTRV